MREEGGKGNGKGKKKEKGKTKLSTLFARRRGEFMNSLIFTTSSAIANSSLFFVPLLLGGLLPAHRLYQGKFQTKLCHLEYSVVRYQG